MPDPEVAIIGGGAAGFFCAAILSEHMDPKKIRIFERSGKVLQKVKISGGGRCNVTNASSEPSELITSYPRGGRELLGPFHRFGPKETKAWFESHGVPLKTEKDGRVFPVSDSSQSIVDCLYSATLEKGVKLITGTGVEGFAKDNDKWVIETGRGSFSADYLVVTTGSSPAFWEIVARCTGHTIVDPVPSLFTFNTDDPLFHDLQGVSAQDVRLSIPGTKLATRGPILITHWGMSGPAVLKLSALAARDLADRDYRFELLVNWAPEHGHEEVAGMILGLKRNHPSKKPGNLNPTALIGRLWNNLLSVSGLSAYQNMGDVPDKLLRNLAERISGSRISIQGKSTFKEEFVTAGGIDTREVDFKRFESRRLPGLFFAGEVLNIDAVTGGFNFQAAWTGAWIAAQEILSRP